MSLLSLQCQCACADAGNEDIVLSTFRQQQKAYRDLLEGMKVSLMASFCIWPNNA